MSNHPTASLQSLNLSEEKVGNLLARAHQEVDEGLLPAAQVAVAKDGQLAVYESYGAATEDSLFCIFSATKAITSSAIWMLLEADQLSLSERVVDIIPAFGSNGKEAVTVEHLLTHTAGFPDAPFRTLDWLDLGRRYERFSQWRLAWEPGSRYQYHPTATMWVLAEILERRGGLAFQQFVREQIAMPLGLPDLYVGLPADQNDRVVPCSHAGDGLTEAEYEAMDIPQPPVTEVTEEAILSFNDPEIRAVGVPGGGGITNAATLALYYQALLSGGGNGQQLWSAQTLADARRVRTGELTDPLFGKPVSRGLGIVIAGDETRNYRGFGHTNSPLAFGHNGAGGQLAWVDPASGISLVYLTSAHDRNEVRQGRRGVSISNRAADLAA